MSDKIVCGVKEPKKGEKRGTMRECADKRQVRYYGVKKVDKKIIDELTGKTKKVKYYSEPVVMGAIVGLRARAKKFESRIETAKLRDDKEKLKHSQEMLAAIKKLHNEYMAIYNRMKKGEKVPEQVLTKVPTKKKSKAPPKRASKTTQKKKTSKSTTKK